MNYLTGDQESFRMKVVSDGNKALKGAPVDSGGAFCVMVWLAAAARRSEPNSTGGLVIDG